MDFHEPQIVELQQIKHPSGTITVAELGAQVPFSVDRIYFIHGLGKDSERGAHAHLRLKQMMIAIRGSFRVDLEGPAGPSSFLLDTPNQGLLVPPLTWRDLTGFSEDAICLVLASNRYDEQDYVRDYDTFKVLIEGSTRSDTAGRGRGVWGP